MTSAKNTEVQEKKADQAAGQSDSALAHQAIIKAEDNRIFVADKPSSATVKSLDLGLIDIYHAHPDSDHAFGPDRRPNIIEDKTLKEVKASAEIRFDTIDRIGMSSADKANTQRANSLELKKLNEPKPDTADAQAKLSAVLP